MNDAYLKEKVEKNVESIDDLEDSDTGLKERLVRLEEKVDQLERFRSMAIKWALGIGGCASANAVWTLKKIF